MNYLRQTRQLKKKMYEFKGVFYLETSSADTNTPNVDLESLLSLDGLGIDMSFLKEIGTTLSFLKTVIKIGCQKKVHSFSF